MEKPMTEATQEGASVHDRLLGYLDEPTAPEAIAETPEAEPVEEVEITEPTSEAEQDAETEELEDAVTEEEESRLELSDFADYLGIEADKLDVDDNGKVFVKTKIDGEEGRAKFSELVKSHQLEGHLNKRNMEVSELKKSLESQISEAQQSAQAKVQQLEDLANIALADLNRQYQGIDWQTLRSDDPAEYSALLQDYQARQSNLQGLLHQAQQKRLEAQSGTQDKILEHLAQEDRKLMSAIEGWDNPDTAQKGINDVFGYLKSSYQFDDADLYGVRDNNGHYQKLGVSDHRLVVLAQKAMLYDQLKSTKPEVSKKVKKAPKIAPPGTPQSQQDREAQDVGKLRQKVKRSGGSRGSVAEYLLKTGKV